MLERYRTMKNSLFKRAIAVAAAAPLALTQCLTVANAASVNNAGIAAVENETVAESEKSIKLNGEGGLLYIAPGKDATEKDYYMVGNEALAGLELTGDSYTITKDSTWNDTALGLLTAKGGATGSVSVESALKEAAKRAGNYQDIANQVIKHVGDVNYTIDKNGDITLTCDVTDIVPELTAGSEKTVGEVFDDIEKKYAAYGVKIDKNTAFSDVKIGGTFTAVIKGSSLDDTKVEGTITFKSLDGVEYKGTAVIDYALAQLDKLQSDAKTAISDAIKAADALDGKTEKIAEAEAQVDDSIGYFRKQLNRAKNAANKAQNKTTELKEYGTFGEALAAAKSSRFGQKVEKKAKTEIPTSGAEIASKKLVNDLYDKAVNQIEKNSGYTVDITTAQLGAFADSLTKVTGQLAKGVATFSAQFADEEKDAVAEYILSEYGLEVTDSYKTIAITADYSAADKGEASVDVKIQRVVEAVTTTTTTSTTTETTTETTATSTETETTSTSTETETTSTGTETTTGSSETTRVERKTVTNYTVAAKTGFYLNIDKEFKKEQIESLYVSMDDAYVYINEKEEVIGEDVITAGTPIEITDKVNFGEQTPANVFVYGDYEFAHKLNLYATEDIMDGARKVLSAGDKLVKYNGEDLGIVAYVGVKGDGDLNYMADAKDASLVLRWYSKMSVLEDPEETVFSNSDQITELDADGKRVEKAEHDKMLDQFAAFLCDVDNENAADNWYALKPARMIDAKDASFILKMYSKASTGTEPNRETWNDVLTENFAKKD